MKNVVIAGYTRSPFHLANKGELTRVRPDDLAAAVVKSLLEKTGVDGAEIEDLIVGCAFPEGEQGFNVAKLIGMIAGLPKSVAGTTVNRFCGSSMQAIHMAAGAIRMNAGEAFIAAGIESMTRVPMMGFNPMPNPALAQVEPGAYMSMGITAENLSKKFGISRAEQEAYAALSHRKAAQAQAEGRFEAEITPITVPGGKVVSKDGCIRPDTTAETLSTLKPAFDATGTVTAGTSSPLTDGASATLICSEDFARAHGLKVLAKIRAIAVAGCDATIMGYGPVPASKKALDRAGITVKDLDIIESNEAFAVQSMTVARELGFDPEKVNIDGGAIALGHPLGATGARITGKAASLLQREGKALALSTQCIGGGQGIATILEAV
ncbi:thiolase family protein [Oleisolibacter albus]|uniref:thiolase family protein n=1 Tax=Oleisolibacter albus TaxID=2171757 RepID=UPI000DF2F749|nr:thiolase family protein [Oleisolibacter albus]